MTDKLRVTMALACAAVFTACSTPQQTTSAGGSIPVSSAGTSTASGYGVVQSIDVVQGGSSGGIGGSGIGLGTVTGAVVGGALGNQVGSGSGRTAATVAGAVGGGLVGNRMEQNTRAADQAYRVTVRMDNGTMHTVTQETPPVVQVGERVRLSNGLIVERFR